jgi:hypothetical protein
MSGNYLYLPQNTERKVDEISALVYYPLYTQNITAIEIVKTTTQVQIFVHIFNSPEI